MNHGCSIAWPSRHDEAGRRRRRGLLVIRLAQGARRPGRQRTAFPPSLHPLVDEWRPQSDGHLRPQAGLGQRRPVSGNAIVGARHPYQRTSAAPGPSDEGHGAHSFHEHARRGPWQGHLSHAHGLFAARPDPVSDARLVPLQGTRRRRCAAAKLCQHCALPSI